MSEQTNSRETRRRQGPPPGRGPMAVEKAKDFKGTVRKLIKYMSSYKLIIGIVAVFAAGSTIFSILGPKVLSKATTEIFTGLMAKIQGTGTIDFTKIGYILLATLALYIVSAGFSLAQGWLMSGVTQRICFKMREDISQKIDRRAHV